ncbi:MAG: translation initiation factor [Lutibacter sp.]|jgi:translation initiation factor 1|nr:translation initiation factor [Lutibacter sp.]
MRKKNIHSLEDLGGFVFSTNDDFSCDPQEDVTTLQPAEQQLEAVYSSKGRGGKVVTVIRGFVGSEEDLKSLGKYLKQQCGVGGSVKDGEIIIQGNHRDKLIQLLTQRSYKVKRVGG